MSSSNRFGGCLACLQQALCQEHHVIPLAYGGRRDGVTVWICSSCHDGIHATANNLTARKVESRQFLPTAVLARAQPLVAAIVRAKLRFENDGEPAAEGRNVVSFPAHGAMRKALQSLRRDAGHNSVASYLQALVRREAQNKLGLDLPLDS